MKRPLPPETIRKIKEARELGKTTKQIMAAFHVSESTVTRHTKKKSWHIEQKEPIKKQSEFWDYSIAGEAF